MQHNEVLQQLQDLWDCTRVVIPTSYIHIAGGDITRASVLAALASDWVGHLPTPHGGSDWWLEADVLYRICGAWASQAEVDTALDWLDGRGVVDTFAPVNTSVLLVRLNTKRLDYLHREVLTTRTVCGEPIVTRKE